MQTTLTIKQKTIKQNELKKGDILLFSVVKGDLESEIIGLLTNAPVSHTAMLYDDTHIVEETPPSATINNLAERIKDRDIYVMRLKNSEDLSSVIDIADGYVKENLPYASNALPFIGLYMIGKRFIFTDKKQKLYCKLLEYALATLIDINNHKKYGGKTPMMCSQFAYHCYKKSGHKNKIDVNSDMSGTILSTIKKCDANTMLQNMPPKERYTMPSQSEINKLLKDFCDELKNNDKNPQALNDTLLSDELILKTYEFITCFVKVFAQNNNSNGIFDKLEELHEYFISPSDLLYNTTNLEFKGMLEH